MESESLIEWGLEIPRDYSYEMEECLCGLYLQFYHLYLQH